MELRLSEKAIWTGIGAVGAYEAFAGATQEEELVTDQVRRWEASDSRLVRYGTRLAIGATALHLLDLLPDALDPYSWTAKLFGKEKNPE